MHPHLWETCLLNVTADVFNDVGFCTMDTTTFSNLFCQELEREKVVNGITQSSCEYVTYLNPQHCIPNWPISKAWLVCVLRPRNYLMYLKMRKL